MSQLTEVKDGHEHYFEDEAGLQQGKYKSWYDNGQLFEHSFRRDGVYQGECKIWRRSGVLRSHAICKDNRYHGERKRWVTAGVPFIHSFHIEGKDITSEVKSLVDDISVLTSEDRLLIKLKYGIECLPGLV